MTNDSEFPGFGRDHFQFQKEKIKFVLFVFYQKPDARAWLFYVVVVV